MKYTSGNYDILGSDNSMAPAQHQATNWINIDLLQLDHGEHVSMTFYLNFKVFFENNILLKMLQKVNPPLKLAYGRVITFIVLL